MNRLTSKLNPTDATDECHPDIFKSDSLKVPKLLFRFSLRAANSLATSIRQSLSVLCLWVLSIVRLKTCIDCYAALGLGEGIIKMIFSWVQMTHSG